MANTPCVTHFSESDFSLNCNIQLIQICSYIKDSENLNFCEIECRKTVKLLTHDFMQSFEDLWLRLSNATPGVGNRAEHPKL